MKLFMIAFVAILIAATQVNAQTRGDERHPTRLPVNVIVDKTSADGNWMKVYEIGGGMHDDLITEMFISNESGINTDELDRLDLVEKYQLLFGLSEMVPHRLITVVAEQQAKELERADWELVGTPQLQGEDCIMPGEDPNKEPPNWPKPINLQPCPEPDPEPIGKEPNPPEPIPPVDGKPIPDPDCWHEGSATWGAAILIVSQDYYCDNFQSSFAFKDWTGYVHLITTVAYGTLSFNFGYWKAGGWVYPHQNTLSPAKEGEYFYVYNFDVIRKIDIAGEPSPEVLYHWNLGVEKIIPFSIFNWGFFFPPISCVADIFPYSC